MKTQRPREQFFDALKKQLIYKRKREQRLFAELSEHIDDALEDGYSEQDAVEQLGAPDAIAKLHNTQLFWSRKLISALALGFGLFSLASAIAVAIAGTGDITIYERFFEAREEPLTLLEQGVELLLTGRLILDLILFFIGLFPVQFGLLTELPILLTLLDRIQFWGGVVVCLMLFLYTGIRLLLFSTWHPWRRRAFPWISAACTLYLLPMFLLPITPPVNHTPLTIPTVNVSERIVHEEVGPFQNIHNYRARGDRPLLYRFDVETHEDGFHLVRNQKTFVVPYPETADELQIIKRHSIPRGPFDEPQRTNKTRVRTAGFRCLEQRTQENRLLPRTGNDYPNANCFLSLNNVLLTEEPIWINDLDVSPDGRWAALNTSIGPYDPETVLLLPLE